MLISPTRDPMRYFAMTMFATIFFIIFLRMLKCWEHEDDSWSAFIIKYASSISAFILPITRELTNWVLIACWRPFRRYDPLVDRVWLSFLDWFDPKAFAIADLVCRVLRCRRPIPPFRFVPPRAIEAA